MLCTNNPNVVIENDSVNKIITMTGKNYRMVFEYNCRAIITSFTQNSHELLGQNGIYSAVYDGKAWITSELLQRPVFILINENRVTAEFSTTMASEIWEFLVTDCCLKFSICRTYKEGIVIEQQGTPILHFKEDIVDNLRWNESGGNFPISAEINHPWFNANNQNRLNIRVGQEQISYTILNDEKKLALSIIGKSGFSQTERGENTLIQRLQDGQMRFYTILAKNGIAYKNGSLKGYFRQGERYETIGGTCGHYTIDGSWLYNPVEVEAGNTVNAELTFLPDSYDAYYDIGSIEGFSGIKLSKFINDFGRWIMNDRKHGGYTEGKNYRFESIPCENHFLTQQVDTFQLMKNKAVAAMKHGLEDMRDGQQENSGHIKNGAPNNEQFWGRNNPDNETGYVLSVTNIYNYTGDIDWVRSFKYSCEKALDYEISIYCDSGTKLVKVFRSAHAPTVHSNDYFEIAWWKDYDSPNNEQNSDTCIGQPQGYTSAMLYDALRRWSGIERDVLNDIKKADYYSSIADILKTNFNKDKKDGGCWLSEANTIMLSSTVAETHYLPAIGAALKSDLISFARKQEMSKGYLRELKSCGVDFLVNNIYDLGNINVLSDYTHLGCEGGMYGGPAGDGYAAFFYANDRDALYYYTKKWIDKPLSEYWESSWLQRDGAGEDDLCFPMTAAIAWGLYYYGYGFQPKQDGLTIAPFISKEMVNSLVKYKYRDIDFKVEYLSLNNFKVSFSAMPYGTNQVTVKWVNQKPDKSFTALVDGINYNIISDKEGSVVYNLTNAGTYSLELVF